VATMANVRPGPFQDFYQALLARNGITQIRQS